MGQIVSCIMPTYNRREFIPLAINSYLSQDWPNKELVVIDDGTERVEDLFVGVPGARYFFIKEQNLPAHRPKTPIGTKRNWACERSLGEIIVHWDDDDWSAPGRITDQVERLLASGKSVTGYNRLLFWSGKQQRASRYVNETSLYACGSSLCYKKSWWDGNRFPATSLGEDNDFISKARDTGDIIAVDGGQMMVARTHPGNSSPRENAAWPRVEPSQIPRGFFEAIANG